MCMYVQVYVFVYNLQAYLVENVGEVLQESVEFSLSSTDLVWFL